ncbi:MULTISPECIES: methyltransferase [Bartonella]|uniref:tRNA1(Val) (adenine(37)-N6)-methyltransferase n=1 Tax=Bartonella TaxID=773 RepID=UPI0018DEBA3A|nr:methyltransferase [Bartonella choladocola]MBI0013787.1 methyltransferase [Bartonella sp. B10834G3]
MNSRKDNKLETSSMNETIDVFHRGGFYLVQPKNGGHRSGMDAMLLGGLVPTDFCGKLADLGAGAGAAGFAVAARCKKAEVTLVEREAEMVVFARKSIALAQNAAIANRIDVISADLTLRGKERQNAGLFDNAFDFAIMNPPFNSPMDRKTPDDLKAAAHVMTDRMFENWIRTASAIVRPSGFLGLIARPQSLSDILKACEGRFGNILVFPVHSRKNSPAIRILIHAKRASKAPLSLMPALYIHDSDLHAFSPLVDAINNGKKSIWQSL